MSSEPDQTQLQVSEGLVHFEDVQSSKKVEAAAGLKLKQTFSMEFSSQKMFTLKMSWLTNWILIDPISESPHFESAILEDGMVINRNELKSEYINILMEADKKYVGGVIFRFNIKDTEGNTVVAINEKDQRKHRGHESRYPYYVIGDGLGDREDKPTKWKVVPGQYQLITTPYGENRAALGKPITINFVVK